MSVSKPEYNQLYDAHCHISSTLRTTEEINQLCESIQQLKQNNIRFPIFNLMSTNQFDHELIRRIHDQNPTKVVANYGIHPWFSHLFTFDKFSTPTTKFKLDHYAAILEKPKKLSDSDFRTFINDKLPEPIYFPDYMNEVILKNLKNDPEAGIGEIGLDKSFRIPKSGYFGKQPLIDTLLSDDNFKLNYREVVVSNLSRLNVNDSSSSALDVEEEVGLTPYKVKISHQLQIFNAFINIAKEFNRPISIHCVKAHGLLYDTLLAHFKTQHPRPPLTTPKRQLRLQLHSYSGSLDQLLLYFTNFPRGLVYVSLSSILNLNFYKNTLINLLAHKSVQTKGLMELILIETDLSLDKLIGSGGDNEHLKMVNETVNELCGLVRKDGVHGVDCEFFSDNFKRFLTI